MNSGAQNKSCWPRCDVKPLLYLFSELSAQVHFWEFRLETLCWSHQGVQEMVKQLVLQSVVGHSLSVRSCLTEDYFVDLYFWQHCCHSPFLKLQTEGIWDICWGYCWPPICWLDLTWQLKIWDFHQTINVGFIPRVVLVCPGQNKSFGVVFNPKSLPVFRCAASSLYVNVPDGYGYNFFPRMTWAWLIVPWREPRELTSVCFADEDRAVICILTLLIITDCFLE